MKRIASLEAPVQEFLVCKRIAVAGVSRTDTNEAANVIYRRLRGSGYQVFAVNPNATQIEGDDCYPDLAAIPPGERVEVVDLFRRSEHVGAHVDEAIEAGARAVWMQLGVIDEAAAARAEAAGLLGVMNRCPAIEYPRWFGVGEGGPPRSPAGGE